MRQVLRQYRWWIAVAAVALLIGVARWAYFAWLPMDGWLTRGWYAMHEGHYPMAEACFTRAARKNPRSLLPRLAQVALYRKEIREPEKYAPFGPLVKVPIAQRYLRETASTRAEQGEKRAREQLAQEQAWFAAQFGAVSMEEIFDTAWLVYPRETAELTAAMAAACAGDARTAYARFAMLEAGDAKTFAYLTGLDGRTLHYYADTAWRLGRRADAQRILALPAATLQPWQVKATWRWQALSLMTADNYHISGPDPRPRAQSWVVSLTEMRPGICPIAPAESLRVVVAPGRGGAHLFVMPQYGGPALPGWWRWDGRAWRAQLEDDRKALFATEMSSVHGMSSIWKVSRTPDARVASSTWSATNEYLSVPVGPAARELVEVGAGIHLLKGHAPREIALVNGELWVHDGEGFTRLCADGTSEVYRGRAVTRIGTFLGGQEALPPARCAVSNDWLLARDGASRLWLVSWNPRIGGVTLRARWDGAAFRPATPPEQQAVRGGVLDSAGRIWFAADLPQGFQRDAWRVVPGRARHIEIATYAVDAGGRVWVVCDAIAARWVGTRWHSIANRLPGPGVPFTNIVASGNGVVITMPGMVAYLE
jgi:hypothetical protein